jgi:polynucleotide 5'-hydroxyl-kinase GRC3/NOL9
MSVGGKGSGKSTNNRYLVNRLLNYHKFVIYIDTDLGQPEFTPSGMMSLSILESPVFGPPFSHIR